jgi:hypothetical protein
MSGSMSKALRTVRISIGKSFKSLSCGSERWPSCCRAHWTRHFKIRRAKLQDGRVRCPNTFKTITRNMAITINGLPCRRGWVKYLSVGVCLSEYADDVKPALLTCVENNPSWNRTRNRFLPCPLHLDELELRQHAIHHSFA